MPTCGTTASSTAPVEINLDITFDPDPSRLRRLAQLLLSPSTDLIVGVSS